jgi:hypothetical protein
MKAAFERQGGIIDQTAEAQRYLAARGANAATFNAKTIIMKPCPTATEAFEEFIHTAQYRTGLATGANVVDMEIAAAEKLIKNASAWHIPPQQTVVTKLRLGGLREQQK